MKSGKIDADKQPLQSLAVGMKSVESLKNGGKKYTLRLLHKQNKVPEYYTVRTFVSIPTTFFHKGDSIVLHIDTYKGEVVKGFAL